MHCCVACQKFAPRVSLLQELEHKFKVLVTSGQSLGIVFWYKHLSVLFSVLLAEQRVVHLFDPRKAISPAGLPELCPIFLHVFFKVWILHLLEFEHFATLHSCIACPKLSKGAFCRTFRSSSRQHGQDLRKRLGQGSGGCSSLVGPPQSQQPRKSTQLPVNFLGLDLGTWAPAAVLFEKFSRAYWLPGISRQTSNDKAGCMARALVEAIQPGSLDPPEGFSQDSPSM